jgi:hypothetical protein
MQRQRLRSAVSDRAREAQPFGAIIVAVLEQVLGEHDLGPARRRFDGITASTSTVMATANPSCASCEALPPSHAKDCAAPTITIM